MPIKTNTNAGARVRDIQTDDRTHVLQVRNLGQEEIFQHCSEKIKSEHFLNDAICGEDLSTVIQIGKILDLFI